MATLEEIADALGDPDRTRILDLLLCGAGGARCSPEHPDIPVAVCACDIRAEMGEISPSRLAYHLKLLRQAGLLSEERRGRWVYYTLNRRGVSAFLAETKRRYLASHPPADEKARPGKRGRSGR